MHGGTVVARALRRVATDAPLFGLCGDHVNAIFDGCASCGIRIVDVRDERTAAFMAQGWSLATGTPGVACVTGGPGLANAVTALADAHMAGVPMVVLTSRIRADEEGRGYPQDVDAATICGGVAGIVTARHAGEIAGRVAESFRRAIAERRPVVCEIGVDALLARCDDEHVVEMRAMQPAQPNGAALGDAVKVLASAERPVAILGEGAFWSGAADAARRLAERAGIPTFTVRAARGLLPDSHLCCFGQPNILREPVRNAFERADALLVAGCELNIVLAFGGLAAHAPMVRIDPDPLRMQRNRTPAVAVAGDEATALSMLAGALPSGDRASWIRELRESFNGDVTAPTAQAEDGLVHPETLVRAVAAAGAGTLSIDAGALALWALGAFPANGPGRLLTSFATPMATMGPGLAYAAAAKLARPSEPSVLLAGDGAFGFSAIELDTIVRHGIGVKIVVGNDAAWGIVDHQMEAGFGRTAGTKLAYRRYDRVAEPLGVRGEHVERAASLPAALERLLAGDDPALLDVAIDPHARHPAEPFIAAMFAPEAGSVVS